MANERQQNVENPREGSDPQARAAGRGQRKPAAKSTDVLTARAGTRAASPIPSKWSWHYRVLRTLQRRLLRKRDRLRKDATDPLEPHSMDEADSATDEFDHDLALAQLSAKENALYEVNQALKRLADGKYGTCEASGEPIPPARLRAIPWARFTQAVEARLEEKGQAASTRVNRPATVRSRGKIWLRHQKAHEGAVDAPDSTVPANDEALSEVYSPPGQRLLRPPPHVKPTRRRTKRGKG